MNPLPSPDCHYLSAAEGWLQLGNLAEAKAEFARIAPQHEEAPSALNLRWLMEAQAKDWSAALRTAQALVRVAPEDVGSWLNQAYALRRASEGSLMAAWEALLPARKQFPQEPVVPYNLACYTCQMHRMDEARHWLKTALNIGPKKDILQMALKDNDLELLWDEIRHW